MLFICLVRGDQQNTLDSIATLIGNGCTAPQFSDCSSGTSCPGSGCTGSFVIEFDELSNIKSLFAFLFQSVLDVMFNWPLNLEGNELQSFPTQIGEFVSLAYLEHLNQMRIGHMFIFVF